MHRRGIFKCTSLAGRRDHGALVMALPLLVGASRKQQVSTDSNVFKLESERDARSTDTEDDLDSSAFSTDGESASGRPRPPTAVHR